MYVRIIRNNSLVVGCAWAEVLTPAPERIMLHCTWRLSALTTVQHGSVIFVLIYFLVLVFVLRIFFCFTFVLVLQYFSFQF